MADIWSGDILLPDHTAIKEVVFASQNNASVPAIPAGALRFLSPVDTARIPLYLAAGSSLDVWTTCEDTEEWFQSVLLSKASSHGDASGHTTSEWWTCARSQSPIGILAQVESSNNDGRAPRITEILFYGTVVNAATRNLPTPPSSSPDLPHTRAENIPELRVHALPLSSDLLHQTTVLEIPPLSLAHKPSEPQFLPSPFSPAPANVDSPKRKRDIFEEATQLRKKARRKGGEGVAAAAAAKSSESQAPPISHRKSLSIDAKASPFPDIRPASAGGLLSRPPSRQLSRSPSISSDVRPLSRKGAPDGYTKRSTLSQVATVATVPLQLEEPTTETRNKEALSRVVMAAMRMYGLQQRKKNRSRRGSVAPGPEVTEQLSAEAAAEDAAKDEEYKLIYHQTYKGAALALRKHISSKPLHLQPDRLRDVVEKLLAIFCTDPLTLPLPTDDAQNLLSTPGSQHRAGLFGSNHSEVNPFDVPSASKDAAAKLVHRSQVHTGSPVSSRKGKGDRRVDV